MAGPLQGVKVVELAGIGPGPMCAMLLSDLGAEVVRVDRPVPPGRDPDKRRRYNLLDRGRHSIVVDLKHPAGVEVVLRLVEQADALIEGFRPGVTERLGLGPDDCAARNPRLVYGRMTGWGQDGPLAEAAGHDINYLALTGGLAAIGSRGGPPTPPLNLVGDFGGGALFLALGLCAALLEARSSGQGQVVDAAMVDGAASLLTSIYAAYGEGTWALERGTNIIDSGAHFYGTYRCADGEWLAVGAMERKFHAELLARLGLDEDDFADRLDRDRWDGYRQRLTEVFATRTRAEWCELLEGTDACVTPVLSFEEAPAHPHNVARGAFSEVEGVVAPSPAPRFSRTPSEIRGPVPRPGQHTDEVLAGWGWSAAEVDELHRLGAVV